MSGKVNLQNTTIQKRCLPTNFKKHRKKLIPWYDRLSPTKYISYIPQNFIFICKKVKFGIDWLQDVSKLALPCDGSRVMH